MFEEDGAQDQWEKDQAYAAKLRAQFDAYKAAREGLMDPTWNECYRLYRSQQPEPAKLGDWKSRILPPHGFTNVEDVVPHLMEGVFGGETPFKLVDRKAPRMAEAHNRLCDVQWNQQMNAEYHWEEGQRQKAIYGTTAYFVGFKTVFTNRRFWEQAVSPVDPSMSSLVLSEHQFPEYIGNFIETVNIFDCYPHPQATHDHLIGLFWVRPFKTVKEIEQMAQGLGTLRNMEKLNNKQMQTNGAIDGAAPDLVRNFPGEKVGTSSNDADSEATYRVLVKFDELARTMCMLVGPEGSEVLVLETPYPYFHNRCPIVFDRYTAVPKEFWGMGVIEPNIALIHESTLIRNQRRDNVTMAMNGMLEVRENEIDDEQAELVSRPMGIVHSRSGKAITPISFPIVTADALREEEVVRGDIRGVTGLGGPLSGQTDPNSPSGTKFSLQQKGQLVRLSRAIKNQLPVLKAVVYMMDSNNQQFYPVKEIQQVLGPQMFDDWDAMTDRPVTINLNATIEVKTAGLFADEDVLRQQFTNWLNVMFAIPGAPAVMDLREVARMGTKLFPDLPGIDRILKDTNLMPDMMEHRMANEENKAMARGEQIPPADPMEDKAIHLSHHYELLNSRPDLFLPVGQHIQTHEQAEAMRQQMELMSQIQATQGGQGKSNGPGSAPKGNGGGVDHDRQPSPTGAEGVFRGKARMQGRTGA